MDENTKTLLIIFVFVIITILLFKPFSLSNKEKFESPQVNMSSSFTDTDYNVNRVNESNNIARYCADPMPNTQELVDDQGNVPPNNVDRPYTALVLDSADINTYNNVYFDLVSENQGVREYVQLNDWCGSYDQNCDLVNPKDLMLSPFLSNDVQSLDDLSNLIDKNRKNALVGQ